jgi:hypothetical protein
MNRKLTIITSFTGLFFIAFGISLLVFYFMAPKSSASILTKEGLRIDTSKPKVAECPISGEMYTKAEEDIWNTRRPIVQIIENHLDSRPVSGISKADVVYEAVAEGGITRFAAVFYCGTIAEKVKAAPLRSARVYFVNLAAGYGTDPIFLHQGGANSFCSDCPGGVKPRSQIHPTVDAYALLDKLGWRNGAHGNDMDGGFNVGFPVVVRDQYRLGSTPAAWEHSVVVDLDEVYNEAKKREFDFKDGDGVAWTKGFIKWQFQDGKAASSPSATSIKFGFWESMAGYDVEWKYDAATNSYKRFNGGSPFIDNEFDKPQVSAKNVVIMFVKETGPVDSEKHMFYEVIGDGKALIFQNGEVVKGTWSKDSALDREVFYDDNRKAIPMVRGTTWIEVVPALNTVSY